MTYKKQHTFEDRQSEGIRITQRYPDRIPIIVEREPSAKSLPELDKHKYLVPRDLTVGQFIYVIRKRMRLSPEQGLFMFVNNTIPPTNQLIGELYDNHVDPDLFLYITYCGEAVFG